MTRLHIRHRSRHAVRHVTHSPHHDTKTARTLKRVLWTCIVLLGITATTLVYLTFIVNRSTEKVAEQTRAIDALLQQTTVSPKPRRIVSSLGFSVSYDTTQFRAEASVDSPEQMNNKVFIDSDLSDTRAYTAVTIASQVDSAATPSPLTPPSPRLTIETDMRKDYWVAKLSDPAYTGLSKLDILAQHHASERLAKDNVEASSLEDVVIAGVPYKKVVYVTKTSVFGTEYTTRDVVYFAVQNDRPYVVSIGPITENAQTDVSSYEAIMRSIVFEGVDAGSLTLRQLLQSRVAGMATMSDLPSSTTKTPYDIEPSTIIDVILRNQPAVVRVATAYCSNIELLLPNGTVGLKLDNACAAYIGSGSIISTDGYIATNGHVATIVPENAVSGYSLLTTSREQSLERIQTVLKYMRAADLATDTDISTLLSKASSNEPEAIAILSSLGNYIPKELIRTSDESISYAIQTSATPIKYNIQKAAFEYGKYVIPATLVTKNFDANQKITKNYAFGTGTTSDVALLKASGTFPIVMLGSTRGLEPGDDLTAIGFPAFTDGGLMTTKSKTPPTATQGAIRKIENEQSSGLTLLYTNVPIAQGFSGGPTFNDAGKQVGLNTYSLLECQDQECFGDGVARDIADLKDLLTENNITLQTDSPISENWQRGLAAFAEGNYRGAVEIFNEVSKQYPAHYLADSISEVAVSKYGTPSDTSDGIFTSYAFATVVKVLGVVVACVAVGLVGFLVYGSKKHGLSTHYRTGLPHSGSTQPGITQSTPGMNNALGQLPITPSPTPAPTDVVQQNTPSE